MIGPGCGSELSLGRLDTEFFSAGQKSCIRLPGACSNYE